MSTDTRAALERELRDNADWLALGARQGMELSHREVADLAEVLTQAADFLARSAPKERDEGAHGLAVSPDSGVSASLLASHPVQGASSVVQSRISATVQAVAHELEHGDASEGDPAALAWCARMLRGEES